MTATYFVESHGPPPPADKCEIDLSGVVENLQGAVKTYAVIDPAAKGLFEWLVQQGGSVPRQGPVSETLFCGEPVLFFAGWRPDQNVSAVRFEIPQPGSAESIFVDMPITPGANKTQREQVVPGLPSGQVLPLYVHVTMQPAKADRPLQIKLKGGQFRAEDRRIVLEDLTVGDGTLADIPGYLWEPVEVPVRATFRGYKPEDLAHHAALEQFKKSCAVTVAARTEEAKSVTDTMEWTSMTPAEGPAKTCTLIGHVTYTPEGLGSGRHRAERGSAVRARSDGHVLAAGVRPRPGEGAAPGHCGQPAQARAARNSYSTPATGSEVRARCLLWPRACPRVCGWTCKAPTGPARDSRGPGKPRCGFCGTWRRMPRGSWRLPRRGS